MIQKIKRLIYALGLVLCTGLAMANDSIKPHSDIPTYHGEAGTVHISYVGDAVFALNFDLKDGWKIYHTDSHAVGASPMFQNVVTSNIQVSPFYYPDNPLEFHDFNVQSFGYMKRAEILFKGAVSDFTKPIGFTGDLHYVACHTQCVPITHTLDLSDFFTDSLMKPKVLPESYVSWSQDADSPLDIVVFLAIIGLSFIGGLILNVMPCVLPVLSLKVISLVDTGRAGLLYIAGGIISVFLVIGAVLSIMGNSVGWGFQFQQSWFVIVLLIALVFLALSLWDKVHFRIPDTIVRMLPEGTSENAKHYMGGVLTTVLATPCTAPFLGTALGFVLGLEWYFAMVVFLSMGLGMASPYIIIYAFPSLHRRLPKPGDWMGHFKRIMSIPLIGLIVYLAYTQYRVLEPFAFAKICVLLALSIFWIWTKRPYAKVAMGILVMAMMVITLTGKKPEYAKKIQSPWIVFDESRIPTLVAQGKTVVVDITAQWCITCRINDITTYRNARVQNIMKRSDVVMMRGDWTLPSDMILGYIHSKGRNGIPLTVIYSPSVPDGLVLPEVLFPSVWVSSLPSYITQ